MRKARAMTSPEPLRDNVIPFPAPPSQSVVMVPKKPGGGLITAMTVRGYDLEGEGLFAGDTMILQSNIPLPRVKPGSLCVINIKGDVRRDIARKLTYYSSQKVVVESCYDQSEEIHPARMVEVKGVAIAFQRAL